MFKKIACSFVSLLLIVSIAGCSLFVPHKQSISINGTPANATVFVNGRQYTTPTVIPVKRNKDINIVVSKDGYNTFHIHSGHSLSTWGILDVIGGACVLVPFLGLLSPGAFELDQDNFYYVLTPVKH